MSSGELTGRRLGEFVVRDKLGEGGFGEVYRAEQPALEREAVIKVLHARHLRSPEISERFLREARLASRLDHPYAAHIYAFGAEGDGLLWIAMELVRGTPLDQILLERGPLPLDRLVPLLDRLCEVVHTAHEQGIVHRDLKPANVMVIARAGRMLPKLLDLGVAKLTQAADPTPGPLDGDAPAAGSITRLGDIVGSPRYMAPEQWLSSPHVDARTDVYALGVLAYQALTGRAPFDAATLGEIARAHAQGAVPPLGDGFPLALDAVFRRALAKAQDDRHASALELAAAFRDASGVDAEPEPLPHLPEALRDRWLAAAPQPLAEELAALEGARNAHQAQAAAGRLLGTLARWLAVLALASRRGREVEERERQAARALHRRHAAPEEWLEIARALTRADAARPELHPIPELVRALQDHDGALLTRLLREPTGPSGEDAAVRAALAGQLGALAELLGRFDFLCAYAVVVPAADAVESWMGLRRAWRHAATRPGAALEVGRAYLLDGEGRPLLALSPLVQAAPPTPGAPFELFVLDGAGRRGARLTAAPRGFELEDEAVWEWLGEKLARPVDREAAEVQPYRGLAPFLAADASSFFGREAEQAQVLNRLRVTPFLVLVGASGAGKSSLLHAGVVPHLPEAWEVVKLRPGRTPLLALEAAMRPAREARCLVVDQLEELFTLTADPAERIAFAERLAAHARGGDRVIATLRDDFLARAAELAPLRELLPPGIVLVTTPGEDDLLRILTLPAERAGHRFDDPELPGEMVAAVAGKPGALALLSFTAARLWEERDRSFHLLTRRAYAALGGVAGALAQHAEDVRAAMTAEEQALLREAFRHLVTADGTRAVLRAGELEDVLGGGAMARAVIDKLIAARLLVIGDDQRLEIIHEALLDAWPRLVDWRRDDAEGARLRDQLRAAARQWDERGRPNGLLWRGDALAELERWRVRFAAVPTAAEAAFAEASRAEANRTRRLRRILLGGIIAALSLALIVTVTFARRASEARAVAVVNAARANQEQARAEAGLVRQLQEQGRQLLLIDDATRAYPYLVEAYRRGGENPALAFLLARAARLLDRQLLALVHERRVSDGVFTRDGTAIVTASYDGTAGVWDASSGKRLQTLAHGGPVTSVVLHPDGQTVLTGSEDQTAARWDLVTGQRVATFAAPEIPLRTVEIDATGNRLLGGGAGAALLWDVASATLIARLPAGPGTEVRRAGFLANGRVVTLDSGGTIGLWGPRGEPQGTVGPTRPTTSLAVRGELLVQPLASGEAVVWQIGAGLPQQRAVLAGHTSTLFAPAIDPAGLTVATTSADQTVRLWPAGGGPGRVLRGHDGQVFFASFDERGERLASVGADGAVRIWDVRSGEAISTLTGHADQIFRVRFSADGTRVVSAGFDGTARVWALGDPDRAATLPVAVADPVALLFVAADELAAVGEGGRLVRYALTDRGLIETGALELGGEITRAFPEAGNLLVIRGKDLLRIRPGEPPATVATGEVDQAVPLGQGGLAVVDPSGEVVIYDRTGARSQSWRPVKPLRLYPEPRGEILASRGGDVSILSVGGLPRVSVTHGSTVVATLVAPGGDRILTAGTDRVVRIWDRDSGKLVSSVEGHTDAVLDVAVTADGRYLATTSQDGTVRLWDAREGDALAIYRIARAGGRKLAFSPDGRYLASIDGSSQLVVLRVSAGTDTPARQEHRLACQVPFTLKDGRLIPLRRSTCR